MHPCLNYPYGWWENTGSNNLNINVQDMIRDGSIAELHTVYDGRFKYALSRTNKNNTGVRAALDAATVFTNVHTDWQPRIDQFRRRVQVLDRQVHQAKNLRRALIAYQLEKLHMAHENIELDATMTLSEAVETRRKKDIVQK